MGTTLLELTVAKRRIQTLNIELFDYNLPEGLIAQYPAEKRDGSRLFVVHRDRDEREHRRFFDILDYIRQGDLLVMNDSRVIHARLIGEKIATGGKVELFLLRQQGDGAVWEVLAKPAKRLHPGDVLRFSEDVTAEVLATMAEGSRLVRFRFEGEFSRRLDELGKMPLPPYIKRKAEALDDIRYQTVYARLPGSVAAPTAGLHFTEELLSRMRDLGVETVSLTLHVGLGTFRPVQTARIEDHRMHSESYHISEQAAKTINDAKADGRRVLCVGTTSVRTLESAARRGAPDGDVTTPVISAGSGDTDIFIYPGYRFRVVDGLLTNFHLPKSTLLMLISAFYDREKVLALYREAVENQYRFFSYGDAMLLL
jgi:S-adenosylmethionine:tRNA ribosyltransferase-isomerase